MRIIATIVLLGAAMLGAPILLTLAPVTAALLAIACGIALSALASEHTGPIAIACGAAGALAFVAIAPTSLELGGAALTCLVFAPRALRARTNPLRVVHLAFSLASGGAAIYLAHRYAVAAVGIRTAAVLVSGLIAAMPLAIPADDPIAFALVRAAGESTEPGGALLLRAAFLRRRVGAQSESISPRTNRRLERAWLALVETARARVLASRATVSVLDARIASHIDTLERVYAAADERLARASGLDDRHLAAARMEGDSMAAEASALEEVVRSTAAPVHAEYNSG